MAFDPAFVEHARQQWNVPALELAVVGDGEVLFADAFGAASGQTLFHHGSVAKSFTSTLVASLVADGLLGWDDRVGARLAGFGLADPAACDRVTVRDFLAHRSGLAQHDFAWMAHPADRRVDLLGRMRRLGPGLEFRQGFLYCNFGYLTVGEVIGAVTGSSWDEQLVARVLEPAGMTRTMTSIDAAAADPDQATPHSARLEPIEYRSTDGIAAAGAVISCATDMAGWVQFSLDPPFPVEETRTVQVGMGANVSPVPDLLRIHGYGMGWVSGTYRGEEWVWHSGGIDGFWSHVALLPARRSGVAVSANVTATRLSWEVMLAVCDWLLGVPPSIPEPPPAPDLIAPLVPGRPMEPATYHDPGYGTLVVAEQAVDLDACHFHAVHDHDDTWRLVYPAFPELPLSITFEGDIASIPFEPATGAICFTRA